MPGYTATTPKHLGLQISEQIMSLQGGSVLFRVTHCPYFRNGGEITVELPGPDEEEARKEVEEYLASTSRLFYIEILEEGSDILMRHRSSAQHDMVPEKRLEPYAPSYLWWKRLHARAKSRRVCVERDIGEVEGHFVKYSRQMLVTEKE